MKVRYRFRCYPSNEQQAMLAKVFGACRWTYNTLLRMRTDAFYADKRINYVQSSAIFTKLRNSQDFGWLREVSCVPPQQALRHLQTAFTNFFEKRAKHPSFKKKHGKQAAEYTRSAFKFQNDTLSLSQIGNLKIRWSRTFSSSPTTVTITKSSAGRYFVTLVLDEPVKPLAKTGQSIGIDLGIKRLLTLSDGTKIDNPKHFGIKLCKLARLQRSLCRRKKGSHRYEAMRCRVALLHEQIADARKDTLDKITTDLVQRFDLIVIEDLDPRSMARNRYLSRFLSDASFGEIAGMLEYKCARYGKELRRIDRWFPSSKRCSHCGYILDALPLNVREWGCPECGASHDRDHNAAINILAAGHAATAQGEKVRPRRSTSRKGISRRTGNHLGHLASGIPRL